VSLRIQNTGFYLLKRSHGSLLLIIDLFELQALDEEVLDVSCLISVLGRSGNRDKSQQKDELVEHEARLSLEAFKQTFFCLLVLLANLDQFLLDDQELVLVVCQRLDRVCDQFI